MKNNDVQQFMEKVKSIEKGQKLDLSSGEDLSIGVMNLISIEEHLFFSAGKTGKTSYYELLQEVRAMRVSLMKDLIKQYGGEEWCISKHLLAASMRVMEVGTKMQTKGETQKAYSLFQKAYDLFTMFWALNLQIIEKKDLKKIETPEKEKPLFPEKKSLLAKMGDMVGKMLDCCRE